MIKGMFYPHEDEIVEFLMPRLWVEEGLKDKVQDIVHALLDAGYSISCEVEIHGSMEKALNNMDNISDTES